MQIKSKEIVLVNLDEIHPWSKNANSHPKDQIDRLCEIIKYQGFRSPLEVEIGTNDIVSGCGRYLAAKKLKMKKVPVIFQSYDNEDQKYARMVSENAIAEWSKLELSFINDELAELGPDFNVELLGLKDFELEPLDRLKEDETLEKCDKCGQRLKKKNSR